MFRNETRLPNHHENAPNVPLTEPLSQRALTPVTRGSFVTQSARLATPSLTMRGPRLVASTALLIGALSAACTAEISGNAAPHSGGASSTVGGGSMSGMSGATASGGSAGASVDPGGPGRVVMHRLNIAEYDNTVRDLLQTKLRLSDNFPPDDTAYGFDNVAAALNFTDVSLGYYIDAAKKLAAEALTGDKRATLVSCDVSTQHEACVRTVSEAFVARAWRRPAEDADVTRLVGLYTTNKANGASDDEALQRVLQGVLLAPNFLFRIEQNVGQGLRALDGYEMASRLSYFLWGSMPDSALFDAAKQGALADSTQLATQAARLLADAKAKSFADSFGSQWLTLRSLDNVHPDAAVYPQFDDALRAAMREETMHLFTDIVAGQRPLSELLTTRSGYVNDRLATHYGMTKPGSTSSVFAALPAERVGLLTQASILSVLAHPKESAPVLRGKWILSQLLCRDLPPPPPDVPQEPAAEAGKSRRDRLAAHRVSPVCASCHNFMDPLGLALENFDGVGAYRTTDSGVPIDPSGQLSTGEQFAGPLELAQIIAKDPALPLCMSRQVFTYGMGRAPRSDSGFDSNTLSAASADFVKAGQAFPSLVKAIVLSDAFRKREDEVTP